MYARANGLCVSLSALALVASACGGDDPPATSASLTCMPMMQSVPGSAEDPCPQNTPQCPSLPGTYAGPQAACNAAGCVAISTCQPDMRWATTCQCIPKTNGTMMNPVTGTGGMGGGAGAAGMPMATNPCGNGVLQAGEQCEANVAITDTCETLGMGTGMLSCNPTTCTYDTSMCMPSGMMGGSGG